MLKRCFNDDGGAVLTEHAILGGLIFAVIAVCIVAYADRLSAIWGDIAERVLNAF